MSKKVIVVGASSGIGAEIAKELLKSGAYVTLIARREKELNQITSEIPNSKYCIIKHDVINFSEAPKLFQDSLKAMEGLDEIYYCAGILEKVAVDEFSTEKDIRMLNINTLGAFAWLNLAADYFQKKNSGKIIGISSVAGDRGRIGSPAYNTSKAALNTYLESLRNRLARKGIQVLTVKPGFIDTDMTKGMKGLFWLISANEAARIIINAAANGKEDIYVPARWALVGLIIRMIPSFIFKKLNI
ncbi:MAG TPA: SDR family NAD(P)-dependent oxidoreductase [Leptospiraceae bacterium]|nr:SDR family NAD(P)-dependent oxidoreductase [Leptospiraceae bacterium]HMW05044.1 SDR family NAD(P)-dependent oxidoreductase [Leptospiraceae bacterium]HMX31488.1 SDR family NAD(P)-dependent oxidoreductase [Leptospiraceae bacterium]HMY31659.1 SDR family NAD(P)-dependent oxidoreductase [Leptospiraceae bacterium]HMZ62597.1 SDR family NAD(P)-dependent oxidoreductase [Leptospiraceae bacterium]